MPPLLRSFVRFVRPGLAGVALAAGSALAQPDVPAQEVQWLSEIFPPFSFAGPGGARGIAVELARESMLRGGLPEVAPVFMPWPRVLVQLASDQPVCVTLMTRTAKRESQYQWVGTIVPDDLAIARRADLPAEQAARPLSTLQVVLIRGDVSEEAAVSLGLRETQLHRVSDPDTAARMLMRGRVDAWLHGEAGMRWTLASQGVPNRAVVMQQRQRAGDNYFACSRAVSPAYISRLQQGLDEVKRPQRGASSLYERIISSYLAGPAEPVVKR
jgi:polar amino acid transport system substrate-binding protein